MQAPNYFAFTTNNEFNYPEVSDAINSRSSVDEVNFHSTTPYRFNKVKAMMMGHFGLEPQSESDCKRRRTEFGMQTTNVGDIAVRLEDEHRRFAGQFNFDSALSCAPGATELPAVPQLAKFTFTSSTPTGWQ